MAMAAVMISSGGSNLVPEAELPGNRGLSTCSASSSKKGEEEPDRSDDPLTAEYASGASVTSSDLPDYEESTPRADKFPDDDEIANGNDDYEAPATQANASLGLTNEAVFGGPRSSSPPPPPFLPPRSPLRAEQHHPAPGPCVTAAKARAICFRGVDWGPRSAAGTVGSEARAAAEEVDGWENEGARLWTKRYEEWKRKKERKGYGERRGKRDSVVAGSHGL
ncbi:hypothetical protein B0J12DRAFT_723459 [Macrophomina phaseolina]|uniref:Uncharacterized protein n=1 Tax=Macrophomina phaseolina TaxID=35725 RepID=A0ABQ8GWM9_9PEZI|nr:hypothetical protein B0J12DRAFT_723459 [Macrophomina phaseolina]